MSFTLYPAISINEIDRTTSVPSVGSSAAAFAGVFPWGPMGVFTLIGSELDLVNTYEEPASWNYETFFTAANFLAYSGNIYISRAGNTTSNTGFISGIANSGALTQNSFYFSIKSYDDYVSKTANTNYFAGLGAEYIARYPGSLGNSLLVSQCENANQFSSNINLLNVYQSNSIANAICANVAGTNVAFVSGSNAAIVTLANAATFVGNNTANLATLISTLLIGNGDLVQAGNSTLGFQNLQISNIGAVAVNATGFATFTLSFANPFRLVANLTMTNLQRYWQYAPQFSTAPGQSLYQATFGNTAANDQMHVAVIDQGGMFTGVPGSILETYVNVSRGNDNKQQNGLDNYYRNVINRGSAYAFNVDDRPGAVSANSLNLVTSTNILPQSLRMTMGQDGATESNVAISDLVNAYNLFSDPTQVSVDFILTGKSDASALLPNWLINNLVTVRRDCVLVISPRSTDVINNPGLQLNSVTTFEQLLAPSSYWFIDSGYKYQYDKYNDINRYVPLNGDMAGLMCRTDQTNAKWYSPAGYNRGQVKNVIRLAWNPTTTDQAALYRIGVNAVVSKPGQGTVLLDDQTGNGDQTSAFNAIGVRRLFILLEQSIAAIAKYDLFEFNDAFTQQQFVAIVTPFLQSVQTGRGITAFRVVCDSTNNTQQIVDQEKFVGDMYVQPARSIRFIQLNFIAVNNTVQFDEVVGTF